MTAKLLGLFTNDGLSKIRKSHLKKKKIQMNKLKAILDVPHEQIYNLKYYLENYSTEFPTSRP